MRGLRGGNTREYWATPFSLRVCHHVERRGTQGVTISQPWYQIPGMRRPGKKELVERSERPHRGGHAATQGGLWEKSGQSPLSPSSAARTCLECGMEMPGSQRADARYCSGACKQKAKRRRKEERELAALERRGR